MDYDIAALMSPPDYKLFKRVLCVQPHPDDNEIGMGGTIAVLAGLGCEVHYLNVTKGDQGNNDQTATPTQTAKTRMRETELAGRHLGAAHFHYLAHGDGILGSTLHNVHALSIEIASVIRQVQPDAVFCPDPSLPYEGHLDHIVTGHAVANAFQMSGRKSIGDMPATKPCNVQAIGYYFTANPNTVVDITDVFERKFEAIAMHESQMDAQTLQLYRVYFGMKGQELAAGKGFALGEGLRLLSRLHTHCFVDAMRV